MYPTRTVKPDSHASKRLQHHRIRITLDGEKRLDTRQVPLPTLMLTNHLAQITDKEGILIHIGEGVRGCRRREFHLDHVDETGCGDRGRNGRGDGDMGRGYDVLLNMHGSGLCWEREQIQGCGIDQGDLVL